MTLPAFDLSEMLPTSICSLIVRHNLLNTDTLMSLNKIPSIRKLVLLCNGEVDNEIDYGVELLKK